MSKCAIYRVGVTWSSTAIETGDRALEMRETPASPPIDDIKGIGGIALVYGRVSQYYEHNVTLADYAWAQAVLQMLRTPAVAIGVDVARDLMLSAAFHIEAPKDASEEPQEYMREALGLDGYHPRMDETFEDVMTRLLQAPLCYGHGVHELDLYEDDGRVWLHGLRYREPISIYRWHTDERERLTAVEQRPFGAWIVQASDAAHFRLMEANRLLTLHWGQTGTNFTGVGMLRPFFGEWRDRDKVAQLAIIGAQRYAVPTPEVVIDIEIADRSQAVTGDRRQWLRNEMQAARDWAQRYISGHDAFLVRPPWWIVGTFGNNQLQVYELTKQIEYYDRMILTGYLAQFLVLGTEGGSYSLGRVQASIAQQRAVNILQWVTARFQSVVERLMIWNFGDTLPRREYPRLTFDGIRASAWTEKTADLVALISAGAVSPDDTLEATIRKGFDLPEAEAPRSVFDRTRTNPLATQAGQVQRRPLNAPLVQRRGPAAPEQEAA